MISDYYFGNNTNKLKTNYILMSDLSNQVHTSNVDRIPRQYIRRDYIVDKIYYPNKMLNK